MWPHAFEMRYIVTLTGAGLSTALAVTNTGVDPFTFTAALHTYFAVPDVTAATVRGLRGLKYEDNAAGGAVSTEEAENAAIVGEVDRVYLDAPEQVVLTLGGGSSEALTLRKSAAFRDLVVWNLGEAKAPSMADLGTGEWQRYLCLEAGAVGEPVCLAPGAAFEASQSFEVGCT